MSSLTEWLMSMIQPIVRKVLASLGVCWLSYEGVGHLADSVRDQVVGKFGDVGGVIHAMLALSGFIDAVGVILGAIAAISTFSAVSRLGKMLT